MCVYYDARISVKIFCSRKWRFIEISTIIRNLNSWSANFSKYLDKTWWIFSQINFIPSILNYLNVVFNFWRHSNYHTCNDAQKNGKERNEQNRGSQKKVIFCVERLGRLFLSLCWVSSHCYTSIWNARGFYILFEWFNEIWLILLFMFLWYLHKMYFPLNCQFFNSWIKRNTKIFW